MKKIYKSKSDQALAQSTDQQLAQYLRQSLGKRRIGSIGKGSLALLAPLAASGLIPTQLNAQACVFPYTIGAQPDVLLDIDGDGLATFLFANANANFQYAAVLNAPPGDPDGPANAGIGAADVGGYYYVQPPASATTYQTFATLNYFGGDPLTGGGTFNVVDANGNTVAINITISPTGDITVNTVGGVAPVPCSTLPLPVELMDFALVSKEKSLQLNWKTATESNNKGFEIERSTNGLHFRKIGWVAGEGTSSAATSYAFEDRDIKTNVEYYYRLRQVDFDGKSVNSAIVRGMIKGDATIQFGALFPNPVRAASLQVEVVAKNEDALLYTLYDQLGKVVLQGNRDLQAGMNNLRVSVQGVANGNYYLKMQVGEVTEYKKVAIQK